MTTTQKGVIISVSIATREGIKMNKHPCYRNLKKICDSEVAIKTKIMHTLDLTEFQLYTKIIGNDDFTIDEGVALEKILKLNIDYIFFTEDVSKREHY